MNSLFLSPAFPPNAYLFCTALRARGATVLAIGDVPAKDLRPELRAALHEYVFAPQMDDYEMLRQTVARLVDRHGPLGHLDSNGEHWLAAESRLRDDFAVPGVGAAQLAPLRSKHAMATICAAAGIAHPSGILVDSVERVRCFAREHGFPLVFKPDTGSGAADTFPVANAAELTSALAQPLPGYIVQPFIAGDIVTFDGLLDHDGRIIFCTSHAYDTGIMQVRRGALDGYYYSLREIPPALEAVGRRAVAAFNVRGRFFHVEFFATPAGYVALEINIRPPGGFTTDMMNDACDIDVYDLWAAMVAGGNLADFTYARKYHTAHAGRRDGRAYALPEFALIRELGTTLVSRRRVPDAFAITMGNTAYLLRHPDLAALQSAIALVQAPAS